MQYINETDFRHDQGEPLGVLLSNLGTPDAPTVPAVRRYLAEFLNDPRVVELPRALWWLILHGVILRTRPARTAHAYQSVWTPEGSPLLAITRRQVAAVTAMLAEQLPGAKIALGMRYGNPSIPAALAELRAANVRRLLVLPLYPQYSATTTASTFVALAAELSRWRWVPELRFVNQYNDEPGYIAALAASVRETWAERGEPDRLLFSFHGIPMKYFLSGDPYHCQCHKTARLVAEGLKLTPDRWQVSFQSRLGTSEWLRPYTDEVLREWGGQGVGSVHVLCAGFAADCLETLEEVAVENRGYFLKAGGREYHYIPALNDRPDHVEALVQVILRHTAGWPEAGGIPATPPEVLAARRERARLLKASA